MRRNRKQQKNREQIELFDGNLDQTAVNGIDPGAETGDELSSLLERERALTSEIMERIADYVNLNKAYQQVVLNGGGSGIDGMDIEGLKRWYGKNTKELREAE